MTTSIQSLKQHIKTICRLAEQGKYLGVMIWGAAGVGKSASVRAVADELGIGFIDLRLSLLNPVDLRGLPTVDREKHKAEWLEPEFLPNGKDGKRGILFLDEINLAPQSVMSAAYQLILDRRLGNYEVPDGWVIVAAGNRSEDNQAITKMPAPLANRFVHFEIVNPDADEWKEWAIKNGIHEQVVAFISKLPGHLYVAPKAGARAFPTPRSWSYASILHSLGIDVSHAVGDGAGADFKGFLRVYQKMPSVDEILEGKEKTVPKELDVLYALSIGIAYRAKKEHIANIFKYIASMPTEFQVLTILSTKRKSDEMETAIIASQGWRSWVEKHKDITNA